MSHAADIRKSRWIGQSSLRVAPREQHPTGFSADDDEALQPLNDQLAPPVTSARPTSAADNLVSALIPETQVPVRKLPTLPLAELVDNKRLVHLRYALTSIDVNGRLADRSLPEHLGWQPGDHLAFVVAPGALLVLSNPDSGHVVTRQGRIRLPAALRHNLNLQAGDRLLVNAIPDHGLLVIHTLFAVDQMVLAYHRSTPKRAHQ